MKEAAARSKALTRQEPLAGLVMAGAAVLVAGAALAAGAAECFDALRERNSFRFLTELEKRQENGINSVLRRCTPCRKERQC